jgi:arginyl-tRNA synthetase
MISSFHAQIVNKPMKSHLEQLLQTAIVDLQKQNFLPQEISINPQIERTRDKQHGDYASNVALSLAKAAKINPRELAEKIISILPSDENIENISIAGPGFINFTLTQQAFLNVVKQILKEKENYGSSKLGEGQRILIEFVSANPNGPLHVGHGRGAAYGSALADLLENVGYQVEREYYVNDGGRQMDILATSIWLRYLELFGEKFAFPCNAYQGDYVTEISRELRDEFGERFRQSATDVFHNIPKDEKEGGDKEEHIDALIARAKTFLGNENYEIIFFAGLNSILSDIKNDLTEFGVKFDRWFSERSLLQNDAVKHAIEKLVEGNHVYEQNGAIWFRSTDFGDDKDRVLLRDNGQPTYFAVDVAYHLNKLERGFTKLINIFGADHHGYVPRLRAAISALGYDAAQLMTLTVQFAVLYRGKERVQMSTRSGSFVTLRELRDEVGKDAARFFYVLRKCEQHMDFDLDLAKSKSNENPVFYVQYAYARIASVFRQLKDRQLDLDEQQGLLSLSRLEEPHEKLLLEELTRYPEIVDMAARSYEPHLVAHYLRDLASAFHAYYNAHAFLVEDIELRNARLVLILATKQVLANGLKLLGVSAPEEM